MPPHIGDRLSEPSFGVRGMQEQYLPESLGRCALRIRLHCSWRPYDPSTCGAEAASGMHLRPVACTFSHLRGVST